MRPSFANHSPPKIRGRGECRVRAAPAVSCAKMRKQRRTRAYRFSGEPPAFPAQWFDGLFRALPGDEFVLSPSSADQGLVRARLGRGTSADLAPATGARTTRFCRTLQRRSSGARRSLTDKARPAIDLARRRCRVHRIPCPTFVTMANALLLRAGMGRASTGDLPDRKRNIFLQKGWTEKTSICPSGTICSSTCESRYRYLCGIRSKLGMPSGMWWNGCLSMVKIAICGVIWAGLSSVPTFTTTTGRCGRVTT